MASSAAWAAHRRHERLVDSSQFGPVAAFVRSTTILPSVLKGTALRRQLDIDADDQEPIERSELVRYALQLGFKQADADPFEILRDTVRDHATQDL